MLAPLRPESVREPEEVFLVDRVQHRDRCPLDDCRWMSLSRAALRDLFCKGKGPVVVRLGRRTMFKVSNLEAFIEQHRAVPSKGPAGDNDRPLRFKRGRPPIAELMARQVATAALGRPEAGKEESQRFRQTVFPATDL